ncbi:tyrosine-type recombinase/integrase [Flavobacterium sp.]|uniref:tyrosine-type recombinase/integrase n=1 Tax=Flavobacterium sp. TaxID=239 RepID=UPI002603090F|nr:tyrosine-type recombinase/integrase [Flavobacterium sp.]
MTYATYLFSDTLALPPLSLIPLPDHLSGVAGTNRSTTGFRQISANTDIDAIGAWLDSIDTETTRDSYRRESERLCLWSIICREKPVSSLTHDDMVSYQSFLKNPEPTDQWILKNKRKVARSHPDWRPFANPLNDASRRQSAIILNSFFSWLVNAGYLAGNPLSLSRRKRRKVAPRVSRYLDESIFDAVKLTIERMPKDTDRERAHYYRTRWLFSILFLTGMRISEVAENEMGGFFLRRGGDGEYRWWLEITGKGDKTRLIPASAELMEALALYRREKALSPTPVPGDTTPILMAIGNKQGQLTRGAIHLVVKKVFKDTAERLKLCGPDSAALASQVEQASAHWLRHTAASRMANSGVDLRHIMDTLGHESISTTSPYLHTEADKRHDDTTDKHKLNWYNDIG